MVNLEIDEFDLEASILGAMEVMRLCRKDPTKLYYFEKFLRANAKFAEALFIEANPYSGAFLFAQDYLLNYKKFNREMYSTDV